MCWSAVVPGGRCRHASGYRKSTAHRRFLIWSRAGVWGRLHEAVLHRLDRSAPQRRHAPAPCAGLDIQEVKPALASAGLIPEAGRTASISPLVSTACMP
jgi:transposase